MSSGTLRPNEQASPSAPPSSAISAALRNRLWQTLYAHYWKRMSALRTGSMPVRLAQDRAVHDLFVRLWRDYFRRPPDSLAGHWDEACQEVKRYFFDCAVTEVFNFIQFVAWNFSDAKVNASFMDACNSVLAEERSDYRFVAASLHPVTTAQKGEEIIQSAPGLLLQAAEGHLKEAQARLADGRTHDLHRSVQKSLAAVQAVCAQVTGNPQATLADALDIIERRGPSRVNASLRNVLSTLAGIHHPLVEVADLDSADARFVLEACSAAVRFLAAKASK
ncbi:MAG: hypothetical protein IT330_00700 [Anaerolineae bacterium]|nr:hypothetical protein [Anaerolineae bacterium]